MRRLLASLLIITFIFSSSNSLAASRKLTIDEVRKLSQENSEGLQSVIIDKIKKEIELKQAYDGIRDIRKKESTVRFSLLFNIKFPEKHGMPKEIELIMKVPTIQNEITVLDKQKPYEKLKSTS